MIHTRVGRVGAQARAFLWVAVAGGKGVAGSGVKLDNGSSEGTVRRCAKAMKRDGGSGVVCAAR